MSGEGVGCMAPRLGKPTVCVLAGSLPLGHFLEGLFNETAELNEAGLDLNPPHLGVDLDPSVIIRMSR